MPGMIQAVPGSNTIYATMQATLFNEDKTTLWTLFYRAGERGPRTARQGWTADGGFWPMRRGMGFYSDPAARCSLILNQDEAAADFGNWEPQSFGNQGCAHQKFIIGNCYDSSGNGVSGATVQGYLTANDLYVGEALADANGRYEFGVINPGAAHYLVAYRVGAPDIAGTTVNTLTGANRDGS
jgi:hypothetical protein